MGLGKERAGIMFKDLPEHSTTEQKAEILFNIKDKEYLKTLLRVDTEEGITLDKCKEFVTKTLFIPSHPSKEKAMLGLMSFALSGVTFPKMDDYEELTIHSSSSSAFLDFKYKHLYEDAAAAFEDDLLKEKDFPE